MRIGASGQKWLKAVHIYAACVWAGCATALNVIPFLVRPQSGAELYGVLWTLDTIDMLVLVPGAVATLITGLVYSLWTPWGWFKHTWIAVKWAICVAGIVFGTLWLGPWLSSLTDMAADLGLGALRDSEYLATRDRLMVFGAAQAFTVVFALFVSTLRPWNRRRPAKADAVGGQ